jgi:pimeloyl-ACP methyl ester carboxylesterase
MKPQFLLFAFLLTILLGAGCVRLDSNLYNPDSSITEYKLADADPDNWDFVPDPSLDIPDSLVHLFTLDSKAADETQATKIYAVYIGDIAQIATDTVILYAHGNAANMDVYWNRVQLLANLGGKNRFGVMMFDYRGFGLSEGTPTEAGMYADAQASLNWLESMGATGDRLIFYGFSLGSASMTELTANPTTLSPSWLILEAPFASAEVIAQDGTGLAVPGSYFTNLKIDNAEEIKKVQQPFLWIHGIDDHFLDYENHGMVVWDNYQGSRGERLSVVGAGHGNVPATYGPALYNEAVLDFVLNR